MNIISVLVDGTANRWIVAACIATWGFILTALPVAVFIHRLVTRRTDRREAAEKAERDVEERARDRTQDLIITVSTATTFNALKAIRREIPRLRSENPPWNNNVVDALELACAHRHAELCAARIREELDHIAPVLTSLQLPAPTTADAIALRANVQAQQRFIEHFNTGLQQIPALARKLDHLGFSTPKPSGQAQNPNASTP